jgi:hypothetical protein
MDFAIVTVNVGGTRIDISKTTAESIPLVKLLMDKSHADTNNRSELFIDGDPVLFTHVVNKLRLATYIYPPKHLKNIIMYRMYLFMMMCENNYPVTLRPTNYHDDRPGVCSKIYILKSCLIDSCTIVCSKFQRLQIESGSYANSSTIFLVDKTNIDSHFDMSTRGQSLILHMRAESLYNINILLAEGQEITLAFIGPDNYMNIHLMRSITWR